LSRDEQARALAGGRHPDRLSAAARQRLQAACTYLHASFAGDIALADVAKVAHMSPAAFSRFFRQALGRTMTEYVTQLRVAAACQLLRETDLPIGNVLPGAATATCRTSIADSGA
jgi:transcriptional regulator GlxA family with amidase domain